MPRRYPLLKTMCLPVLVGLSLAGCTSSGVGQTQTVPSGANQPSGGRQVVAAFYPLAYLTEQLGGNRLTVRNLTRPGVEPHDVELTPAEVASLQEADLVVLLRGFQPSVDEALAARHEVGFDVSQATRLLPAAPNAGDAHGHQDAHEEAHAAQAPESASATDPHFWLDPNRYAAVSTALGARLATLDPTNANEYRRRAADFSGRLKQLGAQFRSGLASCRSKDLVTAHTAFGYLAKAYGLNQVGIAGISPGQEPDPAAMGRVANLVRQRKVRTIYTETLVSPDLAQTVARDSGAQVAVLDPIEGLSDSSAGRDYFEIMQANLATLRKGQGC